MRSEGFATFLGEGNSKTSKIFGHAPTAVSKGNSVNIPKPEGWIEGCSFHLSAFWGGIERGIWIRGDVKVFSGLGLLFGLFSFCGRRLALSGLQKAVTLIDLWDVCRDPGKRSLFLLTRFHPWPWVSKRIRRYSRLFCFL